MLTELAEAMQTLRSCANGIPAHLEWPEVPLKIGKVRALVRHIDQLVADRNADRARLATLTAAAELHRPEARDQYGHVTTEPAAAVNWWCRQCARRVRAAGCATWKAAKL